MRSFIIALTIAATMPLSAGADDELAQLVIRLDEPSPALEAARQDLVKVLAVVKPKRPTAPRAIVTEDSRYILFGDLFKKGTNFALLELGVITEDAPKYNQASVALAEWTNDKWELRGLWNIAPVWRPKNWKQTNEDPLPVHPAERRFELKDFSGDRVPELVIAGEVDKYFQAYYLLRYDPKAHSLRLLEYAMGKPETAGGYVRLYFNSGRRAIYEEWRFLQWAGDRLIERASWHAETPYNNPDEPFINVEVTSPRGERERFVIRNAENHSDHESLWTIVLNEKPFATVCFRSRDSFAYHAVEHSNEMEEAWLFEKLTGLSRKVFPRETMKKVLPRFEDYGSIRISGTDQGVRRLTRKRP